jgi:Lrp/AsnC family leucine-responsive transcriptional regulator
VPRPDLDAIDERILALLVADARRSASEIGRLVTLSPAAAKRRIDDRVVADLPELVESFTLAGDPDALIRVRVSDVDHLKRVIDRVRQGRRGGPEIVNTKTLIVLGSRTGAAGPGRGTER